MSTRKSDSAAVPAILSRRIDTHFLLGALTGVEGSNFTARMPFGGKGVAGEVGDAVSDVIIANQTLEMEPSHVVGREGPLSVTGKPMLGERQHCIDVGANDFVPKPVDTTGLPTALKPWVNAPTVSPS
jgi:hypothetical protein